MSLEARLTRYYKKYNPDQLEKIPYLAKKYQNNDDVLFEALQKKYGPEPKVEDIERMHELAHASNHDIAKRFLGIMAVLSNTINSDSCGLKQQGRVVGEVAMAMAKIKKTNEILREIFTTCRESQLQETWGGLTRSCTIASYFCEFVTFDEEEAKLSQEAKEEDDEDDEIPKEKAMNGMLRVRGVRLISRQILTNTTTCLSLTSYIINVYSSITNLYFTHQDRLNHSTSLNLATHQRSNTGTAGTDTTFPTGEQRGTTSNVESTLQTKQHRRYCELCGKCLLTTSSSCTSRNSQCCVSNTTSTYRERVDPNFGHMYQNERSVGMEKECHDHDANSHPTHHDRLQRTASLHVGYSDSLSDSDAQ